MPAEPLTSARFNHTRDNKGLLPLQTAQGPCCRAYTKTPDSACIVGVPCRSFHHARVLVPTLEACCNQLSAAAGQGPFSAAREALLMACCQTVLEVMSCSSYKGRIGGSASEEQVSWPVHRQGGMARMGVRCWTRVDGPIRTVVVAFLVMPPHTVEPPCSRALTVGPVITTMALT